MTEGEQVLTINPPSSETPGNIVNNPIPKPGEERKATPIVELGVDDVEFDPEKEYLFDNGSGPENHKLTMLAFQSYKPQTPESRVYIHTEPDEITEIYWFLNGKASVYTRDPEHPESERVKEFEGDFSMEELKKAGLSLKFSGDGEKAPVLIIKIEDKVFEVEPSVVITPDIEHATVAGQEGEGCIFLAAKLKPSSTI